MRLLLCLAEHAGDVVSIDDLLTEAWPEVSVSPDSVYQAVASLRRQLGDDPRQPAYIATVPRLGYRMVATVTSTPMQPVEGPPNLPTESSPAPNGLDQTGPRIEAPLPGRRRGIPLLWAGFLWAAGAILCVSLVAFLIYGKFANGNRSAVNASVPQEQKSLAVLPFLDLTEGMKNEEFADGMTEELIDKLSKIPDLRVPAPTSAFFYKNKRVPLPDIAKALGVVYVLDGSVRKSGGRVRVAARLVRADNGYVIWSETYDRPMDDILMVQDDIAGEVTRSLRASFDGGAGGGQSK